MSEQKEEKGKSSVVIELINALKYPFMILFFFIYFNPEINKIAEGIANRSREVSKIEFGGLAIEIEKSSIAVGNQELGKEIKSLSKETIKYFLKIGQRPESLIEKRVDKKIIRYYLNPHYKNLKELQSKGFIYLKDDIEKTEYLFKSLNTEKQTRYECLDGISWSEEQSYGCNEKMIVEYIRSDKLTAKQKEILEDNLRLDKTKNGTDAYHILIDAIVKYIEDK